jgi:hypothetical protein
MLIVDISVPAFVDKEKDLGIPSKFPFKDQILADAAEMKVRVC